MLPSIKTIVYTSDIRPGSRPAFRMAVAQALAHQARIIFLHACEPFDSEMQDMVRDYLPERISNLHAARILENQHQRVHQRIEAFLQQELEDGLQLAESPRVVVRSGKPEQIILDVAREFNAELIVMGDRASSTLSRLFLGSTARNVIHQSPIPVLIVPLARPQ
ncbi:universal stress protein [Oceanobacter mangrovi]|uniref:universal stress protein n=1 Tax=Oceanobacter mangrovi TaxID=2862510 RepID=UPI001C8E5E50